MACVTHVVTNVKLVEVHDYRFFNHPLKELPAGEGLTLFGRVATPDLAGFHNIKLILLCKSNLLIVGYATSEIRIATIYPSSLSSHHSVLCRRKDAFSVPYVKRV